jgi:hypothetical protein
MYLGYQKGKIKFYTEKPLNKALYNLDEVVETQDEYVLDGDEYVLNDDAYKEKQAQKEKERIAMLSLTRGDVFRGLLMAKQVTRAQIRAMIENNELLTMLQKEMALIDFDEALNFYRGNELIDTIGLTLGITSEQLDLFFETNEYTVLLPKEEPTETPSEETFNLEE